MVFKLPEDSLARRYVHSHRQFTWERVRGPNGVKIVPDARQQIGPTCIYVAMAQWMDVLARMQGRVCKISAEDLQYKEQRLMTETTDRTMRCLEVLKHIGVCSEEDFNSQNPDPVLYKLVGSTTLMPLKETDLLEATRRMETSPLLAVFHVGRNYSGYLCRFYQKPVLSYEKYEEGLMLGHGVCVVGYGVEAAVPFWKFINSAGKHGPTKGSGRLLPQNVYLLIAPGGLRVIEPTPARPNLRKRKVGPYVQPRKRKKMKLEHQA